MTIHSDSKERTSGLRDVAPFQLFSQHLPHSVLLVAMAFAHFPERDSVGGKSKVLF